jgi:predicted O-methyltransferase YrrM
MPAVKPEVIFLDQSLLRVDGVDFQCCLKGGGLGEPLPGSLPVFKSRDLVETYLGLRDRLAAPVIVELGIYRGGSTALLHALFQPERLIAIDRTAEPAEALSSYIASRDLQSVVRPRYGVDQADRATVAAIVAEELAGRGIDLVIDDASHQYAPTLASFETLFPRLRPGGLYVIEDWDCHHRAADFRAGATGESGPSWTSAFVRAVENSVANPDTDPRLVRLPLELLLARASNRDVIRDVTVMDKLVIVRRGEEALDPATFRLADLVNDHFGNLRPLG